MTYLDKAKEWLDSFHHPFSPLVADFVMQFAKSLDEQAQDSKDGSHICDDDCWTVPGKCMLAPIPKEEKPCCAKCYYRDFGDKCKDEDCDCHYKTIADFGAGVPIKKVIEALENTTPSKALGEILKMDISAGSRFFIAEKAELVRYVKELEKRT